MVTTPAVENLSSRDRRSEQVEELLLPPVSINVEDTQPSLSLRSCKWRMKRHSRLSKFPTQNNFGSRLL
jgi:hypothetical protein